MKSVTPESTNKNMQTSRTKGALVSMLKRLKKHLETQKITIIH
jgi:hypothetical protein